MAKTHFVHSEAYKKIVDAARKTEKEKLAMPSDTAKRLEVLVDLAIVVRRPECGCFTKFYFELEPGLPPVDSDVDKCSKHGTSFQIQAGEEARKEADRIREKLR